MVSSIAVAACLEGEAFSSPAYDAYRRRVRTHALMTAALARDLARRERCNVEMVFMCALMHSIGKPVVLRLLVDVQASAHVTINEAEAIALADEYEPIAAEAAVQAWGMPQHVQVAAVYYQRPAEAPEFVRETTITALASQLAYWAMDPGAMNDETLRALPEWAALSLEADEIDEVVARAVTLRSASLAEMV
jgi:putative nucleotidyltransferase with HDIG domain